MLSTCCGTKNGTLVLNGQQTFAGQILGSLHITWSKIRKMIYYHFKILRVHQVKFCPIKVSLRSAAKCLSIVSNQVDHLQLPEVLEV
jgi:hypothetical protein